MDDERRVVKDARRHPEHFVKLYDHYYPKLYAYILSRVRHKERAEDIVANTFMKALEHLDQFTWKRSATFGSWLFRIAKNDLLDHAKKESRTTVQEPIILEQYPQETPDAMQLLMEQEQEREQHKHFGQILTAMQSLTEMEQEVISLKYFSQMSYEDISSILHKKPNTLAVTLRRSLEKIRNNLNV